MKIQSIDTFRIDTGLALRVVTDDGRRGFGETASLTPPDRALLKTALGQPVSAYEVLRTRLADAPGAQAALNMALLDLLGKQAGVPVYQFLGGPTRAKVRVLTRLEGDGRAQKEAGHRAFVVKAPEPGFPNPRHEFVRAAADRLAALRRNLGEDTDFVLDGGGQLPPAEAANLSAALERFHLLWFDEPCPLGNLAAVQKIARENVTPLGWGRGLTGATQIQDLFRHQAIDVLRLDIRLHGITQIRRLAALAETHYTAVAPFNQGGPIATAAAIQLAASLPNFFIQQVPSKLTSAYASGLGPVDHGYLPLSTKPGLGLEINERELEKTKESL
jgi:galactonate dehydratase